MASRSPAPESSDPTPADVAFEDGLGTRVRDRADGEPVERLVVCDQLAQLENALRDRTGRLTNFRHVRYPRIRGVERVGSGDQLVVSVVSDVVVGVRFAELLRFVETAPETFDVNAALQVARELLPALAVLHDSRNVTHGALGPERIVLGPQGRVVIVDHGLGLALERLRYPRSRLWKEFRVAMPPSAGLPQFDQRADVAQVALTILALVLGRPLALREFPDGVKGLLASASERLSGGATRPLTTSLRAWFERALPLESRRPLATAVEAQIALEDVITREAAYAPRPGTLRAFFERYQGRSGGGAEEPVTGRGARGGGRRGAQAEKAGESRRGRHRASQQTQEELEAAELRRLEEELARLTQQELEASAPSATVEPSPGPASDTGETAQPPVPRRVVRFRAPEEGDHGMSAAAERPPADETPAPAPEERDTETPDAPPPPAVLPFPFVVLSPLAPADHAAADVGCSATADARGGPELVATEGLFVAPDALPAAPPGAAPPAAEGGFGLDEEFSLDAELERLVAGADVDEPPGAGEGGRRIEGGEPVVLSSAAGVPGDAANDPEARALDIELAELEAVVAAAVAAEAARARLSPDEVAPPPVLDLAAAGDAGPAAEAAPFLGEEADGDDGPDERWSLTPPPTDGLPLVEQPLEQAEELLPASSLMDELPFDAEPEAEPVIGLPAPLVPLQPTLARAAARGLRPLITVPEVRRVIGARPRRIGPDPRRAVPVVRAPVPRRPAALAAAPEPVGWLAAEAEPVEARLALVAVPDALAMSGPEVVVAADAVAPGPMLLLVDDGSAEPAASPAVDDDDTPAALTPAIELVEPPDVSSVSSEDTLDELLDLLVSDLHASSALTSEEPQADSERVAAAAEATPAGAAFGALDALDTIPRPPEPAAQGEQASPSDASLEGEADAQPPTPFVEVCAEAGPRNADVSSVSDSAEPPAPLETMAERAVAAAAEAAQLPIVPAGEPDAALGAEVIADDEVAAGTPADFPPAPMEAAVADVASGLEVPEGARVDEDVVALGGEPYGGSPAWPTEAEAAAVEVVPEPVPPEVAPVGPPAGEPVAPVSTQGDEAAVTHDGSTAPRRRRRKRRSSRPAAAPPSPVPAQAPPEPPAAPVIAPWLRGKVPPTADPAPPAVAAAADRPPPAADVGITPAVVAPPPWARREREQAPPPDLVSFDFREAQPPETVVVAPIADAPDETLPPIPDRTPIEPPTREADAPRPAEGPSGAKVLRFERQGHVRVHWKRVVAASLVLMVIEGAAFATAYWYVKPKEMGFLWVRSSVPGVAVAVDGQARGRTPVGLELPPGRHTLEMRGFGVAKVLPVEIAANVETSQLVTWPKPRRVGTLRVTSTPTGARVLLDGEPRGVTPLAIEQVAAGTHALVVEGPTGSVEQPVEIEADGTVTVDVPIYSGWLAVFAPIEVRIFLQGRLLGTSLDGRLLVPPGRHQLELVSQALGYREQRTVTVTPGRVTALSVEAPRGTIVIDAPEGTDVAVDGQPVGTTPLGELPVAIGTREVVFRHPQFGQRRVTVTVGVNVPVRASMLRPGE